MDDVLFPEIIPYATHSLDVGDAHELYIEESGNRHGLPVMVLHGGPGSGCSEKHRRRFDPLIYRIVCFDQRGAGRSTPHGDTAANTTAHLLADIERIRDLLKIEKTVLYGTSWGCTLALAYAQQHPERVLGMVLGGVFLADHESFDWFYNPMGLPQMLPEAFAAVQAHAPHTEGHALIQAVADKGGAAVRDLVFYEGLAADPNPNIMEISEHLHSPEGLRAAGIEVHYFAHHCFLKDGQLLADCPKIAHLPVHIVHGALDMVCPPANAVRLHKALPKSILVLVPGSGHMSTTDLDAARVVATTKLAHTLGF